MSGLAHRMGRYHLYLLSTINVATFSPCLQWFHLAIATRNKQQVVISGGSYYLSFICYTTCIVGAGGAIYIIYIALLRNNNFINNSAEQHS